MERERTAWDEIREIFKDPRGLCACPEGLKPGDSVRRCAYHQGHEDGWALHCMLQCASDLASAEGIVAMLRQDLADGVWNPDCARWALLEFNNELDRKWSRGGRSVEPYSWDDTDALGRLVHSGGDRLRGLSDDQARNTLEAVLPPAPHIEGGWARLDARRWEALNLLYARLRTYSAFYFVLTTLPIGRDALATEIWSRAVADLRAAAPVAPQWYHLRDVSMRGWWMEEELVYLFTLQDDPGLRQRPDPRDVRGEQ